ncbi:RidA family protein [Oceanotoga sp. DSM 15011]|jgi:2-iminobutanoate/2-iminopropanoate deaminase|uniref:RidA family protein n=1 Tax=unclassified Oceanotoga TaxID=2618448 RepID=UPI0021F42B11|nr:MULTISPECIES: RidA family protein [unclassified Oceanotoga]MDN5341445.1 2-iminobutanoate/2-iminopropanoate deaminase [Oceanotoga sp.]UYO99097.1 RidA family protein [Oceanotoga sp. DSM 15011]
MKKTHNPKSAPKAIGPYSIANEYNNLIFLSGQLPVDMETGEMVKNDVEKETLIILTNIKNILEELGSSMDKVLKTTVYLKNMDDFTKMNEIYGKFFTENHPSRSAFQVAKLPKDSDVEIEVIAIK